jgi:hypothetical protein
MISLGASSGGAPYDFRTCSQCAAPPVPHLEAKDDRLKAGGLNPVMENLGLSI